LSLRVASTPIVGSSLAQLALSRAETPFFERTPATAGEWRARADHIRGSLIQADWLTPLAPALGSDSAARERLERAATSGIVVTSGQQPGLFGGPLYTWWKALSVLAFADHLERLTGMPVAPVFWAATDDSDFAEGAWTVVATPGGAERIELPPPSVEGIALAHVPLGDVEAQMHQLQAAAGSAASGSGVIASLRSAYSPDHTVGSAFVELLRSVVEPLGVSVIDAAHPAVRIAAHPVLARALERSAEIETALAGRSAELKAAGHHAQVKNVDGRTLVFMEKDRKRDRVRMRDAVATMQTAKPGDLGPNVLLRPIVERSILPTVAYMGGPAEIAYFAQVTVVADAIEATSPVVVPRWSGFVVEPRIDRILERHSLQIGDFVDPHEVESRLARASIPDAVARPIDAMRAAIESGVAEIEGSGSDLVPEGVLEGLQRNVSHRMERLERRLAASVKRRGNDALRDAGIARGALYPFGKPQERALNMIPLLARYGEDLIDSVMKEVRAHAAEIA
jgi:bacillithiol biosynthesis cysteine-adding enzyme BshC